MKKNKKAEKQKEFLKLQRQLSSNWKTQRNLGYRQLEKPIHHGYDAYWTLREDIQRREDVDKFESILYHFSKSVWCRKKDFKKWDNNLKKEIEIKPYFKELNANEYEKLYPWAKKFFSPYMKMSSWGGIPKTMYSVNIPEHFLVMKKVKSYKTHTKIIDEVLKQEASELESKIKHKFYNEDKKYWKIKSSNKDFKKILNRSDRYYNKIALRRNMDTIFAKYDDINDDWGSWLYDWCDDFYEFKYNHKHYGKWFFD